MLYLALAASAWNVDVAGLQAMETLAKLQRNLREEQKLIVQRLIVNHQCTLRPRQVLPLCSKKFG